MKDDLGYNVPPVPVRALLPRIADEWQAWMTVLGRSPAHRLVEPGACGQWSVKDLMAHVAVWDAQVVDDIDGYVARQPALRIDADDVNRREAERRAGWSAEEARAEMVTAHERMVARLSAVDQIDLAMIEVDTWAHYAEHRIEIDRWLRQAAAE